MIKILKDKYILLPLVEKSDFLYNLNITPNSVSIFNNLIVSPLCFYFLYKEKIIISSFVLYIRALLDGVDGYLARKYNNVTFYGEVLDHGCDSFYISNLVLFFLQKSFGFKNNNILLSYITFSICIILNFDTIFSNLTTKITGAGGSYESYSTILFYSLPVFFLLLKKKKIKSACKRIN